MKAKALFSLGSIAISSLALNVIPFQPAQAVNLVTNGDFNTNNLPTGSSGFLGNGTATVPGWNFGSGLNWLVSTGTADTNNLNIAGGSPDSTQKLINVNNTPITSPNGTANWYIVADGDPNFGSTISTLVSGLTPGQKYSLTFYQAAAQQFSFTGGTTEQWKVSFGSAASQTSPLISPIQPGGPGLKGGTATGVLPWQKVTDIFTADGASDLLSFVAQGMPSGMPPFVLLGGVSVQAVPVPEPFTIIGTLVGGTLAFRMRKKLKDSSEE